MILNIKSMTFTLKTRLHILHFKLSDFLSAFIFSIDCIGWLGCTFGMFVWLDCTSGMFVRLECTSGMFVWLDCTAGMFVWLDCTSGMFVWLNCTSGLPDGVSIASKRDSNSRGPVSRGDNGADGKEIEDPSFWMFIDRPRLLKTDATSGACLSFT